jgi:hypothetical protein
MGITSKSKVVSLFDRSYVRDLEWPEGMTVEDAEKMIMKGIISPE